MERGAGTPLVLVPGIQGRWEFSRRTVDALARYHRVITFTLCDERSWRARGLAHPIDMFVEQIVDALDERGLRAAAVAGISFGGLVALRCAARHAERTSALVMVSTPGPRFHLRRRHEVYTRLPWLFGPVFLAETPLRVRREIRAALPDPHERRRFGAQQLRTLATAPVGLSRMAARARMITSYDRIADCARVSARTLVVHGEPALDHVTHAAGTRDYARLIPNARCVQLERTGHLGCMTRADAFASLVHQFLTTAINDDQHSAA